MKKPTRFTEFISVTLARLMMLTVMQIEVIRRKVLVDKVSQRETARELGYSRKTVAKALREPATIGWSVRGLIARFVTKANSSRDKCRLINQ